MGVDFISNVTLEKGGVCMQQQTPSLSGLDSKSAGDKTSKPGIPCRFFPRKKSTAASRSGLLFFTRTGKNHCRLLTFGLVRKAHPVRLQVLNAIWDINIFRPT